MKRQTKAQIRDENAELRARLAALKEKEAQLQEPNDPLAKIRKVTSKRVEWNPDMAVVERLVPQCLERKELLHFATVSRELGLKGSAFRYNADKIFAAFETVMEGASALLIAASHEYNEKVCDRHNEWIRDKMGAAETVR